MIGFPAARAGKMSGAEQVGRRGDVRSREAEEQPGLVKSNQGGFR
jgi:hypothetical protein